MEHTASAKKHMPKNGKTDELLFTDRGTQVTYLWCREIWKIFHALCENRYPEKTTGYCDNNQELWKSKIQGKKVYAPAEAVRLFPEAAFVITISKEAEQAEGQLLELGIEKSRIVCFRPDMDYLLLNTKY